MVDRFTTIDIVEKWGLLCCAHFRGGAGLGPCIWTEANLRTEWHPDTSNRFVAIHQRYIQNRQDRQENGPVA